MSDAKSICVACVGIFIVLAIIGVALNVVEDHMGWSNDLDNSETMNTPTPTLMKSQNKDVGQTSVSNSDTLYDYYFVESINEVESLWKNIESDIKANDYSSLRSNGQELNSVSTSYYNKIASLTVSSQYKDSQKNCLYMLDCFGAAGNYLVDGVDYYYEGEDSASERYFGYAAEELDYGTEYLAIAKY